MTNENIYYLAGLGFIGLALWYVNRGDDLSNELDSAQIDNSFSLENDFMTSNLAGSTWQPPKEATPYLGAIRSAETRYSLPTNLLARLLYQESHYRQDIITGKVKSSVGAIGIAQFMPATAKQFGINPLDANQSIDAAGKYLKQLYAQFGTWDKAVASYNWGQGNVARKGLANAPSETYAYYTQILKDIGLA